MSSSVISWVQAVGSAGAFVAFAAYLIVAMARRKDEEARYAESQAHRVAAWIDEGWRQSMDAAYIFCVHNAGDTPIFACAAWLQLPGEDREHAAYYGVVPPDHVATQPLGGLAAQMQPEEMYSRAIVPEISFTDSSGRQWQRDGNGFIRQLCGKGHDRVYRTPRIVSHSGDGLPESQQRAASSSR